MEKRYELFTPASRLHNEKIKLPHRFFRDNKSIEDLQKMAALYFESATDENAVQLYRQLLLFGQPEEKNICEESCEAV